MDVENQTTNHTLLDIGQALVEARESKQLTAQDIASQMNLSLSVIEKIEANIFKQEIPLAFIRGYLRSYATKVNADVETLSVEFDRQTEVDAEPLQNLRVVSNFKSSRREVNSNNYFFKIISFLIVVSLLGFAGWETWKRYSIASGNDTSQSNSIALEINATNTETHLDLDASLESEIESSETSIDLNLAEKTSLENAIETEAVTAFNSSIESLPNEPVKEFAKNQQLAGETKDSRADLNEVSAVFTFSDNCWVQVTDINGDILAIGEKISGKVMAIKGQAPLSVILGNPSAVEIVFENKQFDMSAFQPGRTAKFELGSSN